MITDNSQETTRILLVEDHASFRQALAFMFGREDGVEVVAQAGTLTEACTSMNEIDVAVVDLALPDGDGVEFIRELTQASPNVTTMVLSASIDQRRFAQAVDAGAAGILHKTASVKEIVESVNKLREGQTLLSPADVIEMLRMVIRDRQEQREVEQAIGKLTGREKEVLNLLAEGLDSKDIANQLHITIETERTHMVNILNKLGLHSRLQALVFAARHGIVNIR